MNGSLPAKRRLSRVIVCFMTFLIPMFALFTLLRFAGAQDGNEPGVTFLGEMDGVAGNFTFNKKELPDVPQIKLQVFSTLTKTVKGQLQLVRLVTPDEYDSAEKPILPVEVWVPENQPKEFVVELDKDVLDALDTGLYSAHVAFVVDDQALPAAETIVKLDLTSSEKGNEPVEIKVITEELRFPFNYGVVTGAITVPLSIANGPAEDIEVELWELKGEKDLFDNLLLNSSNPEDLADGGVGPLLNEEQEIRFNLLLQDLAPGIYSAKAVIDAKDLKSPVEAEFKFQILETSLGLKEADPVFEWSDGAALNLPFQIVADTADAQIVVVGIKELKTADNKTILDVSEIVTKSQKLIAKGEEGHPFTFTLPVPLLPPPGTYKGKGFLRADNQADEQEFTFDVVVPEHKLIVLPTTMVIQRCYPYHPWFTRIVPLSMILGCGTGGGNIELWAVGDSNVDDVEPVPSTSYTDSGRSLDLVLGKPVHIESDQEVSLQTDQAIQEVAAAIPTPTAGEANRLWETDRAVALVHLGFLMNEVLPVELGDLINTLAISITNPVQMTVDIANVDFPGYGAYKGKIFYESPDVAQETSTDVTTNVRHWLLFPLVVIAIGVAFSNWLLKVKDEENSPYLVEVNLAKLSEKLGATDLPPKVIANIKVSLSEAKKALPDDVPTAKTAMQAAQNKLEKANEVEAQLKVVQAYLPAEFGYDASRKAIAAFHDNQIGEAAKLATRAKKQHEEGKSLEMWITILQEHIKKHHLDIHNVQFFFDAIEAVADELKPPSKDFDPERVPADYHKIEDLFNKHLQFCDKIHWSDAPFTESNYTDWENSWGTSAVVSVLQYAPDTATYLVEDRKIPAYELFTDTEEKYHVAGEAIVFKIRANGAAAEQWPDYLAGKVEWRVTPEIDVNKSQTSDLKNLEMSAVFKNPGEYVVEADIPTGDKNIPGTEKGTKTFTATLANTPLTIRKREIKIEHDEIAHAKTKTYFEIKLESATQTEGTANGLGKCKWVFTKLVDGADAPEPEEIVKQVPYLYHDLQSQGKYRIDVTVADNQLVSNKASTELNVLESVLAVANREYELQQKRAGRIGAAIALLGGLIAISAFNTTFGSFQDYLTAFLWGAGVSGIAKAIGPISNRFSAIFKTG